MTTEEVLAHFEHVKAISGGWIVTCPAHDDSTASLSVSTGKDGRTLIHDHAGCDLDAILHAAGLTLADLFPPTNGNGHQPGRSPVVAEYLYRDVDGVVRYRKQRRADKKFFFARPDGHGGWITSREQNHNRPVMEGVERLVYRCNELREQSENASTEAFRVCIGEGCKDADRLWSIGLPATTNDGGAGKWTDALTAQLVAIGVTAVVCFPDNDDPGRAHMQDVARSCTAAGIEARIVALPDLPPKGGDVSDYLDAGHDKADLLELVAQAPVWTPSETPAGDEAPAPEATTGVCLEDFHAYMPMHAYIFSPAREVWPAASVNARIASVPDGERSLKATTWLDQHQAVEQMTWLPGLPMLIRDRLVSDGGWIDRPGCTTFNLYRPPTDLTKGQAKAATPWLDHVRRIYPEDSEHLIAWLAHRVQRPNEKVNHALVLGGPQGVGKDTLLEPVKRAVGPWNFTEITPAHLLGRFNGFVKSVILRISEARDLGDVDRYAFYDHLKVYAAAPPDVLRVDEKNLREFACWNVCGVVLTTNHKTGGLYLPADDRRHYVAWTDLTRDTFPIDYWTRLYQWYEGGGLDHVAAYLRDYDLAGFDPKAPPPKTSAFWDLVDADRAPEDAELADALDRLGNPPAVTLADVAGCPGAVTFGEWLRDRKNARQVPHRMEAAGYVPVRNDCARDGLWKLSGRRQVVYARQNLPLRDRLAAAGNLGGGR